MRAHTHTTESRVKGPPEVQLRWLPGGAMAAPDVQLCGNVCCGVVLSAPLLRCSRCHLVCYCCRACQTQAWKAGHKRECGQAAAARRVEGESTDSHRELIKKMIELCEAQNWRGLVALEVTASAAAAQLRETRPDLAAGIYGMLGTGCWELGQYDKAITLHKEGDRSDGGRSGETGVDVGSARGLLHWATAVC